MGRPIRLLGALAALWWCAVPAAAQAASHPLTVVLRPAPGNLSLAELSFARAGGRAVTARSLRIALPATAASLRIAVATPLHPRGAARVALVLVANRPAQPPVTAAVRLHAVAAGTLGSAALSRLEDPLGARRAAPRGFCRFAVHGRAPALAGLAAHGAPVSGLSAAGAVAQAFAIACGLPHGTQLEAALAQPASEPAPPGGPGTEPPRCAPCDPKPGFACPLHASAAYCVAGKDEIVPVAAVAG
jgi:hypothetical protein